MYRKGKHFQLKEYSEPVQVTKEVVSVQSPYKSSQMTSLIHSGFPFRWVALRIVSNVMFWFSEQVKQKRKRKEWVLPVNWQITVTPITPHCSCPPIVIKLLKWLIQTSDWCANHICHCVQSLSFSLWDTKSSNSIVRSSKCKILWLRRIISNILYLGH